MQNQASHPAGSITYAEISAATQNFATARILGRGGFGPVYSCEWRGRAVAIKALDSSGLQGSREFYREVDILSRYRHQHLVPLLAYHHSVRDDRTVAYLVYPRMESALDDALLARPLQLTAAVRLQVHVLPCYFGSGLECSCEIS